ncbi:mechanosensitive ion channel domain-containing protein [Novosphingobium sp.]|uniref:mechanosensitive ion channel family protein n=1 Tax=Novosphingobium sp. TaxID=1874826 RepID=UPI0031D1907A
MPFSLWQPTAAAAASPGARPAIDLRQQFAAMSDQALDWGQAHWLQIVIAAGMAVAVYLLLNLLRGWGVVLCRRGHGSANWFGILGQAISKTGQFFILTTAARLVVGYATPPPFLNALVLGLFTIAAVFQGAVWLREIVFGIIEHRTQSRAPGDPADGQALVSALSVIRLLISIVLFAVASVVVLGNLGINVTGLVAGLGVGGIAIGLAAQGIFADLFAALAILIDRPFGIGDSISYDKGSGSGTVESIGLKSTRIRAGSGEQRVIANKNLLNFEILNTTRRTLNTFKFEFVLDHATSPDLIPQLPAIFREAVESEGFVLKHGGLNGFSATGLSYDVEFASTERDFPADARDKVAAAVLRRLREHEISFAYPTQINLVVDKSKPEARIPLRQHVLAD